MEIIGYIASIFIGITLGLIGAGGSILTVPIMVYLFQIKPELATAYSLFIVGISAGVGAFQNYKEGFLKPKMALDFAMPSIFTLIITRYWLLPLIPNEIVQIGGFLITKNLLIMVVFAVLMIFASYPMIRQNKAQTISASSSPFKLIILGIIVGIITGFLGAGGGFMIIPALVLFGRLEMKTAIGTSLLIICINTLIGFTGDLIRGVELDFKLLLTITFFALAGIFIGNRLAVKIPGKKLKPIFGWFVLIMGTYIIIKETLLN
jgi:uncharacterized membrane protein YfcA